MPYLKVLSDGNIPQTCMLAVSNILGPENIIPCVIQLVFPSREAPCEVCWCSSSKQVLYRLLAINSLAFALAPSRCPLSSDWLARVELSGTRLQLLI